MIDIKAYRPGTYVRVPGVNGEMWCILTVRIELREQDILRDTPKMVQMLTLLAVDENAENLDWEPITINVDMYDIIEL